jgi:hypothetical protein
LTALPITSAGRFWSLGSLRIPNPHHREGVRPVPRGTYVSQIQPSSDCRNGHLADAGMLDVVGFDTATPGLIADFIRQ